MTPLLSAVANHLWQSTVFACVAGLLTLLLRKNRARVRYAVWMAASFKFLIPFAVVIALGSHIHLRTAAVAPQSSAYVVMDDVSQPFTASAVSSPVKQVPPVRNPIPTILIAIWAVGFIGISTSWLIRWWRIRRAVRAGSRLKLEIPIRVVSSSTIVEPGVFGTVRPVLFLPEGISERLTPDQLKAVISHELCHVRYRDNLIAAIQMLVETVFWFHPMVWWMGKRMVDERERACDEDVLRMGSDPGVYAEAILKVCQFYLESPVACVSGITGSDLKRRIQRIMMRSFGEALSARKKLLLATAGAVALAIPLVVGALNLRAQSVNDLTGTWQGTLQIPGAESDQRLVFKISRTDNESSLKGVMYFIDPAPAGANNGGRSLPVGSATLLSSSAKILVPGCVCTYEGTLSGDGNSIKGTWSSGRNSTPLNLARATTETAWEIPVPRPPLKPMAADADPSFEVASIKLARPDEQGRLFHEEARQLSFSNTSLGDIIAWAYRLHPRQISGGPAWMASDRYDILAEPDVEGHPNLQQWKNMMQKLLADRFKLVFHLEKRELPVYAIVVGKNGPKLTPNTSDPNGIPGLMSARGDLPARNASMAEFAVALQLSILDRPVVDQTGLTGKFDFELKWTPDETQFTSLSGVPPSPTADNPNAPPDLFTAMQEQLGLRLESKKAPVDVLVIDHAEHPSPN